VSGFRFGHNNTFLSTKIENQAEKKTKKEYMTTFEIQIPIHPIKNTITQMYKKFLDYTEDSMGLFLQKNHRGCKSWHSIRTHAFPKGGFRRTREPLNPRKGAASTPF
jgi:hypothetical protein